MFAELKHPKSGELKRVKVGFSWTLFLFSGFMGLPLFLRRLYVWGAVFFVLWLVNFFAASIGNAEERLGTQLGLFLVFFGLEIFFGIKGNEMTAKNLLEQGWVFANPESEMTRMARLRWGLAV